MYLCIRLGHDSDEKIEDSDAHENLEAKEEKHFNPWIVGVEDVL